MRKDERDVVKLMEKLDGSEHGFLKIRNQNGHRYSNVLDAFKRMNGALVTVWINDWIGDFGSSDRKSRKIFFSARVVSFMVVNLPRRKGGMSLSIDFARGEENSACSVQASYVEKIKNEVLFVDEIGSHDSARVIIELQE